MTRLTVPSAAAPGASPFSIDIPEGWGTVDSVDGAALAVVRDVDRGGFNPNVIIWVEPVPVTRTLDRILAEELDAGDRAAGVDLDGNPGSESIGEINGRPAIFRLVHLTADPGGRGVELDQTQVYTTLPSRHDDMHDLVQIFGTSTSDGIAEDAAAFTAIARSLRSELES